MPQSLAVRRADSLARVHEIVDLLAARDHTGELITAVHHIPAREAQWAPMPEWVREVLLERADGRKPSVIEETLLAEDGWHTF